MAYSVRSGEFPALLGLGGLTFSVSSCERPAVLICRVVHFLQWIPRLLSRRVWCMCHLCKMSADAANRLSQQALPCALFGILMSSQCHNEVL